MRLLSPSGALPVEDGGPNQDSAEPRATTQPTTGTTPTPGDGLLWAARTAMVGANVAGLAVAVVGRTMRLPRAPIAVEAAVSLARHQPWLRGPIENRIGAEAAATVLSLAETAAQTLTLSPAKLAVDLTLQVLKTAERGARERALARHAPALTGNAPATERQSRPAPATAGSTQRHLRRAAVAQAAAAGLAGVVTGNLDTAATAAVVTSPKPLEAAGEAFAATLAKRLADRDAALPLRPAVLRRLDTIDTLLIDPRVLCGTGLQVVRVRGVDGGEQLSAAWSRAQQLLDQPGLTPGWHQVPGVASAESGRRATVDALILPAQHRLASALVREARSAGLDLCTVDLAVLGELRPAFDDIRPVDAGATDTALADALADLQRAGRTVAVLASAGARVLAGADVALGVMPAAGRRRSVAADLLLFDLAGAWQLLHALPAAREAGRSGAAISTGASALGGVLMVPGVRGWRGPSPVTVGAAAGLLTGFLLARRVADAPVPRPAPAYEWHAMSPRQVREVLATLEAEAESPPGQARPAGGLWQFVRAAREELADPLTPVIALCAAATSVLGSPIDAVIVGTALVGNAMIAAAQQLRAQGRLNRLLAQQTPPARTVTIGSDGTPAHHSVPPEQLRLGDVIDVRSNEVVPADARVIEEIDVEVDESSLTGESLPVGKQADATPGAELADRYCMLYAGTTVVTGSVTAIVTAVGPDTQARRAAELASGDLPEVGLQRQLSKLASRAFPASFVGGALVGTLGLVRGGGLRQALGNAIAVAVAAIPEGLPLMATLAQFASARRLSATGALVRLPRAVEALGRLDVVCFDKTGTLSENRLRVTDVHAVNGESPDQVLYCAAKAAPAPGHVQHAHATDQAIVQAATAAGFVPPADDGEFGAHLPFRSGRAFSASVSAGQLSVKGAPEVVLAACANVDADVENTVAELAAAGLRVIAVADRRLTDQQLRALRADPDNIVELSGTGLVLKGFLALADTPRPEARQLLSDLAARDIAVRLITGDHPVTAMAIATELGMPVGAGQVITGAEWDALSRKEREHTVGERVIFARMSPENKVQVVSALKKSGRVCAMVGDGANDAAAIRSATVGIGVVAGGSDAAHTTADIVLTDGRIGSLVDAVDEGRRLWRGVQAAVVGLLGGNAGEVIFTVIGSALTGNTPLNPRQLLLMNMITDALPATAVAASTPAGTAHHDGRGIDEQTLWRAVAVRGAITGAAGIAAWAMARVTGRQQRAATVALIALVSVELGQMLVDSHTPLVVATAAGSFVAFVAMVNIPGISQLLGSTPIGPLGWAQALGAAGAAVLALAVLKRNGRRIGLPVG